MERFLKFFTPENYQLNLKLDRQRELLAGTVHLRGVPQDQVIKLHAVDLQVNDVWLRVADDDETTPLEFQHDGEAITIPIDPALKDLSVIVSVEFSTQLNKNMEGCYLSTYQFDGKTESIAATQFESHYAREAFPCIDEPAAKATFDLELTILDFAPGDVVLANTPLLHSDENCFTFATTPRMSTYLLAWVVGKFHKVTGTNQAGMTVSTYAALNQPLAALEFANQTAMRALEYYDEKFGVPYPLPKLDQVALPDFEAGAMENWGLVTYRESCMLVDQTATLDTKKHVAITVTHELSHQWFGDLVTMAWWDDLWLNESFASVMEFYCTDALYPEFEIWQEFFTSDCYAALRRDALPGVQAVKQEVFSPAEIATLFDSAIVYAKGARLILMLIRLMGDSFWAGMRAYFTKYQYQNTIGDFLWDVLSEHADFNVREFMTEWISQPGYPKLWREGETWQQTRFLLGDEPVKDQDADGILDDATAAHWDIPTVFDDMSGHYLLQLSETEFQEKLSKFEGLSSEQKLRLLIDRLLLSRTTAVDSVSLLDLLPKFQNETSAAVFSIVAGMIADLKLFCPPDSDAAKNYKTYLCQLFAQRIADVDLRALTDTDAIAVRDVIISVAHYAGEENLLQKLATLYNDDLAGLDAELRSHILAAKMYFAEGEVFDGWLERYAREADPELKSDILYVLATFAKQPEHLDRLLQLLEEPQIVRPGDHIFLYIYLLRNSHTRERVLDWLITHWDYVVKITGDTSLEDYLRYAASVLRTESEAQKFYHFFDQHSDSPALRRAIRLAHAEIDARLQLLAADTASVQARLTELAQK